MAAAGEAFGTPSNPLFRPGLNRLLVVILCAVLFVFSQFYRASNAIIAPDLQDDLSLSSQGLGLLSAVFFYVFAAAQLPLGPFLDRVGPRLTMTGLTLIGSIGAWVFATAQTMTAAALGRALLGLGMSCNLMGPMKLFTKWFSPREFAMLSGLHFAVGTLGNMLAATPLALLVQTLGWRWSFGVIGGSTALIALLFFACVRDRPPGQSGPDEPARRTSSVFQMGRKLLSRREYWLISLGTFCRYGTLVAIQGLWAGPYLINGLGYSPVQAGNVLLVLNLGIVLGSPLSGWLSDRILRSRKWIVVFGLGGLALAELSLARGWGGTPLYALAPTFAFLGLTAGFGIVMYAHIKEHVSEDMTGMALTGVNLFTMLGGAFFMQGMGWLMDRMAGDNGLAVSDYRSAFLLGFSAVVAAMLLYLATRDTSGMQRGSRPGPPYSAE